MAAIPSSKPVVRIAEVPDIIIDNKNNKKYKKGKFLGKGGFAKCYELIDMADQMYYAGKVVSKSLLIKQSQKEKMTQEINIHRTLSHKHILGMYGYFEDAENIYILLELCRRRSLIELHKRRKYVSEPEVRYFARQIIHGCQYLHENRVIHRDLKLGNILLNDEMDLKLADFGLATRVDFEGERKKTLCGTPNYIAPEILNKKGHSYEVDTWSLGCIVYTLLVGRPPFETSSLNDTYKRIQKNEYAIPQRISQSASAFIRRLLRSDPTTRLKMNNILDDDFFKAYIPNCLPVSALTTCPRFDNMASIDAIRRPLADINPSDTIISGDAVLGSAYIGDDADPADCWLNDLCQQVTRLLASTRELDGSGGIQAMEESEHPASAPVYWVSKWVDYSDKYGLGYQLCDNSCGVLFNDTSRMLLTANEHNIQYIEPNGTEHLYTVNQKPSLLNKKYDLINYFKTYMQDFLLMAGENMQRQEADDMVRLPFLRTWFRTKSAIVLHLSNGILQVNFFEDHAKIILCPLMSAVTYIDASRKFKTFRFSGLRDNGMVKDLCTRIFYAKSMMERMLARKSGLGKPKIPSAVN